MNDVVLSIDVGGTKTLVGLVTRTGKVVEQAVQVTRKSGTDEIARAIEFGCGFFVGSRHSALQAAVVGVPEYVSSNGSVDSCEVLNWDAQPGNTLSDRIHNLAQMDDGVTASVPTGIESDVRLGALGEATFGAGRGLSSFLYVSLGTGLSSTFVIDGLPWAGARGQAIALGEFAVGSGGNLENMSSGTAISDRYQAKTGQRCTGPEIVERATLQEPAALQVLSDAGIALGSALADVTELLDPQAIVVGGGLGAADTLVMDTAREIYAKRISRRPGAAAIHTAECGSTSALLGGAAAAWNLVDRNA